MTDAPVTLGIQFQSVELSACYQKNNINDVICQIMTQQDLINKIVNSNDDTSDVTLDVWRH